ncbi:MAG: D-alanyl-D-alanine carboxypeptidase family protein [Verrucomicrobiales bacterium]
MQPRTLFSFFSLIACAALAACQSSPPQPAAAVNYRHQGAGGTQYLGGGNSFAPPQYAPPPTAPAPPAASAGFPASPMPGASGAAPFPSSAPAIYADSAIMIDARTGRTLYQKNAEESRAPASTQKLLTALIIAEEGNLSRQLTVAYADTRVEPSKLYLKSGHRYARRDLLVPMMIKSANDAAMALARDNAGSIPAFSAKMNRRARELGAMRSHFANPHGLTVSGQYSNARDMARIAFRAYQNPVIRQAAATREMTFRHADGRATRVESTNKLLERLPGCTGLKTGYTSAAGRCLVSTMRSGGREVLLVQLGTKTKYIWDDAERMMRWGLTR